MYLPEMNLIFLQLILQETVSSISSENPNIVNGYLFQ